MQQTTPTASDFHLTRRTLLGGALGHPELATAEKGEAILSVATREVVRFVREFAAWQPIQPN